MLTPKGATHLQLDLLDSSYIQLHILVGSH